MTILRAITLLCLRLNVVVKAQHVSGCFNQLADLLSHFQFQKFHELAPDADRTPTPVPNHLWNILAKIQVNCWMPVLLVIRKLCIKIVRIPSFPLKLQAKYSMASINRACHIVYFLLL